MRLIFARHGESEANIARIISNRDLPHKLTATGVAQAQALAERLAAYPVQQIWASPIVRAQETAAIVAQRLALPVLTTAALREFDCGGMEGRGDEAAWAAHQAVTQAWEIEEDYNRRIAPDGESYNEMKARFLTFIAALLTQQANSAGDLLLVTHGALLHLMLPHLLTNLDRPFIKAHPLGNCDTVLAQRADHHLICTHWASIRL